MSRLNDFLKALKKELLEEDNPTTTELDHQHIRWGSDGGREPDYADVSMRKGYSTF